MRKLLIGPALALAALAASAQVTNAEKERCSGFNLPAAARVVNCSQLIDSGRFPPSTLPIGIYYRGLAYLEQNLYKPAIADFDKAISLHPGFAQAHVFRGKAYLLTDLYDRAIEDETRGIAIRPTDNYAYFLRALAYEKKGQREKAIADFRATLKMNPANSEAKAGLDRLGAAPKAG